MVILPPRSEFDLRRSTATGGWIWGRRIIVIPGKEGRVFIRIDVVVIDCRLGSLPLETDARDSISGQGRDGGSLQRCRLNRHQEIHWFH